MSDTATLATHKGSPCSGGSSGVGIRPGADSSTPRSNGVEPSGEMSSDLLIGPDGQDSHLRRLSDRCSEGSVGPNTKPAEYSGPAAADTSAAADPPSDTSSAKTPIPAADQADVQAKLGVNALAQARLNVLADLASAAEI
ncbi:unnamed protein product [Phytophthora fragariaefolia]|uniref:Unnamed protein product n=1 Tax=Phytophthora fragariaefolia TaxID=1490495 RepID=A0A9W7CXV7_9STRA|nr:unnamed protein product [Phytophthora fragariaefolia]